VQKALDELGEETAGILQRAHETADEIASRSRAQADGRLQRAEREAEIVRREADEYADQVVTDTRLLWDERQRLLEDIRQLADEVLSTADDAQERLKLPDPLAAADEAEDPTPREESRTPIPHPLSLARSEPGEGRLDTDEGRLDTDEERFDTDEEPIDPDERRLDPSIPYDLEGPEDERDPDATVAWSIESEDDEPEADTPHPYAMDSDEEIRARDNRIRYPLESEEDVDPETTDTYAVDEDEDTDVTRAWYIGSRDDEEDPVDGDDEERDGPGTVELEALPGGNSEEHPEGERRHGSDRRSSWRVRRRSPWATRPGTASPRGCSRSWSAARPGARRSRASCAAGWRSASPRTTRRCGSTSPTSRCWSRTATAGGGVRTW
jgi:hypothetical protein